MQRIAKIILVIALMLFYSQTYACTDIRIIAKDGTILITRTLEFSVNFNSNLRTSIQKRQFITNLNNKPGIKWNAKYGYIYLDGMNQDVAIDGMNEVGLSFEALYLPGLTQYQTVPPGQEKQSLPYFAVGDWILSNFETVDEVRAALKNIYVYAQTIPGMGDTIFPLHFSITDTSGKGIIVEFIKGQMIINDSIGVLTNSPNYDWQVLNLNNYLHLTPYNPQPIEIGELLFSATGQGAGMVGLPGDISPPSRFVKMSFILKSIYPVTDAATALNVAQHIINNVDIPLGLARAKANGRETSEATQWTVFKDLRRRIFYYRTYNDMTLRSVSLAKIDFSQNASRLKMPLVEPVNIVDVTERFKNTKLTTLMS